MAASDSVSVTAYVNEVALISDVRWVWASMKPGSSVASPRSMSVASSGAPAGLTAS